MARPRSEDKVIDTPISVVLNEDDLQALARLTAKKRVTRSSLIREALRQYLASEQIAA